MARGGAIKQRSSKTSKVYRDERVPLVERLLLERCLCQCCWKARPVDVHEILSRGRSGGVKGTLWIFEPNLLCLCRKCHRWITDNPADAEATGFSLATTHESIVEDALREAAGLRSGFYADPWGPLADFLGLC